MKDVSSSKIILQPGIECIYFTAGSLLGKMELPSMNLIYKVESGHKGPIVDMVVTLMN